MDTNRAVHAALAAAGLIVKEASLTFGSRGTVLSASGTHPDGTPFEFWTQPFSTDPVERAHEAAAGIVAMHASKDTPEAAQAEPAPEAPAMSKLNTIAERIQALKDGLEKRSDAMLDRIAKVEERGRAAFDKHETFLAQREQELSELERTIAQITNGAPQG